MRRNGFSFHAERSTRFVQRSRKRGLSPTGDRHTAVSHLTEEKPEDSRQDHFFGFALYLDRSRDARPLPRGLTGHVAHPLRSILHRGLPGAAAALCLAQERPRRLVISHVFLRGHARNSERFRERAVRPREAKPFTLERGSGGSGVGSKHLTFGWRASARTS